MIMMHEQLFYTEPAEDHYIRVDEGYFKKDR